MLLLASIVLPPLYFSVRVLGSVDQRLQVLILRNTTSFKERCLWTLFCQEALRIYV